MSDAKIAYFDADGRAVFRASAVDKCALALTASLLGYSASVAVPDTMQKRFDDGHRLEPELLAHVAHHGFVLYGGQDEYDVPVGNDIIIRGHIDSMASHREYGVALVEAKTMAPTSFALWQEKQWQGSDLFMHYAKQVSLYWEAIQPQLLVMVVGRKAEDDEGNTYLDGFDLSYFFERPTSTAPVKARLAKVLKQARTGEVPDACDRKDYPCPFFHLHQEDVKVYAPWSEDDALDELGEAMQEYVQAQRTKSSAEKAQKAAKKRIDALMGDDTEAQRSRYVVEYTPSPRRALDEDAMRADGIDVDKYEVVTAGSRINVKELT